MNIMQQGFKNQMQLEHLNVLGGVELKHAVSSHHVYAKHMHEEYSLCLMHKGISAIEYRGERLISAEMSISIMNPAEVHACYTANDDAMSYSMLYANEENFGLVYEDLAGKEKPPYFQQTIIQDKTLTTAFMMFLNQTMLMAKETLYLDVLSLLFSRYSDSRIHLRKAGKEHKAVTQIKAFLEANYSNNVSLKQLSDLTQLNQSYLSRVFRKDVGMAPHAYLNNIRLLKARARLCTQPIADVAFELGFADQSHFTRLFKRTYGITPKQYQNGKNVQDMSKIALS